MKLKVVEWRPKGFEHLKEEEIGYFRHMRRAFRFSFACFVCSIKGFIHGFCPDTFTNTSEELEEKIETFVFDD